MMLEVSLDTLVSSNVTAHQFLINKLVHDKKFEDLDKYLSLTNSKESLDKDLNYLESLGFIDKNGYDVTKDSKSLKVNDTFSKHISNGNYFEELLNTYPVKVLRDGGITDYLRTERYNSKRLYEMYVARNKSLHEHILKCLKWEIEHRTANGSMRYMKRLYKWLLTKEWKSYEERVDNSGNVQLGKEVGYGTELE